MAFQVGAAERGTHRPPARRQHPGVPSGRADLHVHSIWSDGAQRPEAIVRAAAGRVDVLAITDHDEIHGARLARDFARAHPALGVEVVVGEEISTRNGHLIGLWLDDVVLPGLSAEETIARIHAQGGLAVAAHPFHPVRGAHRGQHSLGRLIPGLALDGIEVVNNAGYFSRIYDAWAALRNVEWMLPVTAGSDAHHVWYVGSALTRFEGVSAEDLRRALIAGTTRAQVHWSWTTAKVPRHLALQIRAGLRFLRRQRSLSVPRGVVSHLTGRAT
jgi:predicted metal-dependent phosphoesterase TrpH